MPFLGIIVNQKNQDYVKNVLSNNYITNHIIEITPKNIDCIKNVRLETILIDKTIYPEEILKKILSHTKYVVLNADLNIDAKVLEDLDLNVITYGFNNKATFTISSISDNHIIICLQRIIQNIYKEKYEPQEFEIKTRENIDITAIMGAFCVNIIYEKKNQNIQ